MSLQIYQTIGKVKGSVMGVATTKIPGTHLRPASDNFEDLHESVKKRWQPEITGEKGAPGGFIPGLNNNTRILTQRKILLY